MERFLTAGAWRRAAAAAAVAVTLAAAAGRAEAACPPPDEIRVMVFGSLFSNMTTYIAEDAGFFTKHCLSARLVPVETVSIGFAQLLVGTLHFSDSSVGDVLRARQKDLKLKVVVGESAGIPYALVVRKGVPLPNGAAGYPAVMKDLLGKKIGVFRLGTGSQHFAIGLLRGAGLNPARAVYVGVGSTAEQLAALENGAVDAALMADPAPDLAVAGGHGSIVVDLRKPGAGPEEIQQLVGTFQVKVGAEAFLRSHPEIAQRYVLANEDAVRWMRDPANFDELLKHMRARLKLGREGPDGERLFAELAKQYAGFSSAAISRRSLTAWHAFERARGDLKTRVKFEDAVWSGAPATD